MLDDFQETSGSGIDRKEKRRRAILSAALEEFAEKGYDQAVLDDIASKAGVAKGTLYLYYKDKRDLFGQTILFVVDNFLNLVKEIAKSDISPIKKIETLIKEEVNFFLNNSNLFNLFQMAFQRNLIMSDRNLVASLIERKGSIFAFYREIVDEAKNSGAVKSEIPTDDIITAFDGIITGTIKEIRAGEYESGFKKKKAVKDEVVQEKVDNLIQIIFKGIIADTDIKNNSDIGIS